jgi:predicted PurR-regulated permease PerM
MARVIRGSPPPQRSLARSLFLGGAALLALYLFGLRELAGVTSAALLGFAGVVCGVLFDLPTAWLAKRLPRPAAVVLVILVLALALLGGTRLAIPILARQFAILASQIPAGAERLWAALRSSPGVARALPAQIDLSGIAASAFGRFLPFLGGALAALGSLGIVVTIGAFLCADPEGDLRTLDALVPPRHRDLVHVLVARSGGILRRWISASLVTMAIVGILTSAGLAAVGVHGWLGLGLLAFVGTAVPYLGSLVVGAAIAAAGLADSPVRALEALGVHAFVQALLGSVISPLVSRAAFRASPTLLLMFQFIMGASFGLLGVLLAQPLFAVAITVVETLNAERSRTLSDSEDRA